MRLTFALVTVAALTLAPAAPAQPLLHRYSFTADGSDSAGGANATLQGTATVSGGALRLSGAGNAHATLPIGSTVAALGSFSIEAFVTAEATQLAWMRVFDFGTGTPNNMFLTTRSGDTSTPRFAIKTTALGVEQRATAPAVIATGVQTHFVVTLDDPTNTLRLYSNGVLVATNTSATATPSGLGVTTLNYLGRSIYGDPLFKGSIDEFRIYGGVLSPAQVAANYVDGPGEPVPEPGAALAAAGLGLAAWRRARRRPA